MKKIAILSPTGMLGSTVYGILKNHFSCILVYRDKIKLERLEAIYGNSKKKIKFDFSDLYKEYESGFQNQSESTLLKRLINDIGDVDAIINCVGIIKPRVLDNPAQTFFLNGALPNLLSDVFGSKLIHITTDCVYSGISGAPYSEGSIKSPNDLYGLSKSLGEPSDNSLVIRTSIIGPELFGSLSLLSWFRNQNGEVKGYTNHLWNGITAKEFANICKMIILNRSIFPDHGLFHVYSTDISKYDLLKLLQEKYKTKCKIVPYKSIAIDRRLRSNYDFNSLLNIPSISQQILDL